MASNADPTEDQEKPLESSSTATVVTPPVNSKPSVTKQKLYIYVLRTVTPKDKYKIKGRFDGDVKFSFDRQECFNPKDPYSPCIHIAEIDVEVEESNLCYGFSAYSSDFLGLYSKPVLFQPTGHFFPIFENDYFHCIPHVRVNEPYVPCAGPPGSFSI